MIKIPTLLTIFNCAGYENILNIKNSRKSLLKGTIMAFRNRQKNYFFGDVCISGLAESGVMELKENNMRGIGR
jgi:hypothetical protein